MKTCARKLSVVGSRLKLALARRWVVEIRPLIRFTSQVPLWANLSARCPLTLRLLRTLNLKRLSTSWQSWPRVVSSLMSLRRLTATTCLISSSTMKEPCSRSMKSSLLSLASSNSRFLQIRQTQFTLTRALQRISRLWTPP